MLRRLFLVFTLAFLFGLGQQGAAVHAISHFAEEQGQTQDNKAAHGSFCDKCVTYAALGSAVGVGHFSFVLPTAPQTPTSAASISRRADPTSSYAARAPPTLV